MVQVDNRNKKVIIEIERSSVEEIVNTQTALIDLIQNYRFDDFGQGCGETIYSACNLLREILPNYNQQKRGFVSEANYIELAEDITLNQKQILCEAMNMIDNPAFVNNKNVIYEAIKQIKD